MSFLKAIISPSYWLTHQHPVPQNWVTFLTVLFGLLVLAGLVTMLLSWRHSFLAPVRTLLRRISAFGWTMGLIGLLLLFFSTQQVAFLSARLMYLIWGVAALVWLYKIVYYGFFILPARFTEQRERREREKYLPKAS